MTLLWIILASFFISAISFVGVFAIFRKKFSEESYAAGFVSFAAGIMLSAAFFDVLPEALELHPEAGIFSAVFAGMVVFFFLERFVLWFHHHHEGHGAKPTAILILVGDGIHNMLDGVAIAAAFIVSPMLGITTVLAIAAHEIPQEIADFSVLTHGGMTTRKALMWNFLSALTAMIGAVLGYFFLSQVQQYIWWFLAFAGGMFLYIASSDLIPELHKDFHRDQRWQQTYPFIAGIIVLWLLTHFIAG